MSEIESILIRNSFGTDDTSQFQDRINFGLLLTVKCGHFLSDLIAHVGRKENVFPLCGQGWGTKQIRRGVWCGFQRIVMQWYIPYP